MSSFAARTDVGLHRLQNQDEALAVEIKGGAVLLAVADGVAGAPGGEVASREAITTFGAAIEESGPAGLEEAIRRANSRVVELQRTRTDWTHMSTTLVAAIIQDGRARVANIGDSRAYAMVDRRLKQLSRDDSWVADAVDSGEITLEQAELHPWRNVVTKVIGMPDGVEAKIYDEQIGPGDALLLATDGLFKMLTVEEIERLLLAAEDAERATAALVDSANAAGGMDNIGVALYRA